MLIDTLKPQQVVPPTPTAPKPVREVIVSPTPVPTVAGTAKPSPWLIGVAAVALAWAFFPTLDWMIGKWIDDPSYSHGFLVPVFSAFLLRRVWESGTPMLSRPQPVAAGLILLVALPLRYAGGALLFHQLDAFAMLLSVFAGVVAFGGFRLARVSAPAMAFLLFMVPLPYELEQNVGGPLKQFATTASTFGLQTLGYPAVSRNNIIEIDDATLGVVDACSGLKMLLTFSAFAVGAVLLQGRTVLEQFLLVLGFVPIAILTNVLRIIATGVVYATTTDKGTRDFSHDLFGWLMMPVGLALLALQLWVQGRLVLPPNDAMPAPRWGAVPAAA